MFPKTIRERLGLKQGDRIELVAESGAHSVSPSPKEYESLAKYAGALGTFRGGQKEINAWPRDLRGTRH
jgi:bifunctional DNA-binding transcriptional regulator/antitoxin component of YhaV-PrlF toxin-antitoxin module